MRDPPVKKTLYWCDHCNVPLVGKHCGCGSIGRAISLLQPYDVRPALAHDRDLLIALIRERFGDIDLPNVILLNKTGGVDRNDLVIIHGERLGWLSFDPVSRKFRFDLSFEGLPYVLPGASRGIVDLKTTIASPGQLPAGRIGGKRLRVMTREADGTVIVKHRKQWGTGTLRDGYLKVKEIGPVPESHPTDPGWEVVVDRNRYHLKNLERNAIRAIRQHIKDRPRVNVSFSGGKDSTAVLALARKAGVSEAFFIDTGIEFPETVAFVEAQGVEIVRRGGDFWAAVRKAGPPAKDRRWCCKLLKLNPLKLHLAETGPCVTIQGNRWYESWNRADLDITSQNPANPLQLNISPIRNWRALEVYLYLWWQHIPFNLLYELGLERIGCYLCPAMLESESMQLETIHPEYATRWNEFLREWADSRGLPPEYYRWGLWRWKELPPKMKELCRSHGVILRDDSGVVRHSASLACSSPVRIAEKSQEDHTMNIETIRKDFPQVADLIYLDSAATSLSPEPVLEAVLEFERNYRANVGRGVHRFAQIATQRYWHAHEKVARFIGGNHGTTVFTKNTTEAINMVARGLGLRRGDRVVTTILEHHSNLIPWMHLRQAGIDLEIIGINEDYTPDLSALETAISDTTTLVALSHASNALGVITPVSEVARICRDHGALLLVDGSQSVPHLPINVERLGIDFLCFSGHKMLGPTGTGVLWMKEPRIEPSDLGGGMIETVTEDGYTLAEGYQRYEAGTPNISGGIGLGAAVDYLDGIGMDRIRIAEERLTARLIDGLRHIDGVGIYVHSDPARRIGVVSFTISGYHPHEIAKTLDEQSDIMVRSGHHCCMPLMQRLGLPDGTVRASLYLYSTEHEVDTLLASVQEIAKSR
ncbi:MAG: putative cysteine desulfurase 2 [Methanoregulaceae archaeon PtaB.Bin108]|nr:MAG: putative cysteine desulfurase 2 [Methanoregulaceae archaeon PtaB.Bin108]OPY45368.1 MAG: putative cysteine desulfurase 2 [Methanoregulaceae archaeon PtaU1.Bin222]